MVSASKLKRAQQTIENYTPYMEQLTAMAESFVNPNDEALLSITEVRPQQNVAIVAFASNGSLCGAFNSNIFKKLQEIIDSCHRQTPQCNITIYAVGKKVSDWAKKRNIRYKKLGDHLTEKPDYQSVANISDLLMKFFTEKKFDKIEIVYNHVKNTAVQQVRRETLLPIAPIDNNGKQTNTDYIIEPSKTELISVLIPKMIRSQFYGALLDSIASEHGARTTAMQMATENADQLIQVLNNLFENAGRHMKGGKISVDIKSQALTNEEAPRFVTVTVMDTGEGISPELLPYIFERGISGSDGTGMGLAMNLAEARRHINEASPDLIVLDIMLPDGDGVEYLNELRVNGFAKPVLLLTAKSELSDEIKGIREGGDDYITKPYDNDLLLARISSLLRRGSLVPETITKGSLKLETYSGQAYGNGENLNLTRREFDLVFMLVQNEDRLLSVEYLYEKVWGQPLNADNNSIKALMSRIRVKIEPTGYTIEPVRLRGYIFTKL